MTVTHNTALRTDVAALLATTFGVGAKLSLYDTAQANPNAAATGLLVCEITLPASPYATPAAGSADADVVWSGNGHPALAAPTNAVGFRFASSDGSRVTVGSVGLTGSGADLTMDNTSIAANQEVRILAASLVCAASGA